jgi:hypothetical protein
MTTRALPCHPWPLTEPQLAALKEAKASLNLDCKIQPVRAAIAVPLPVLAFEELPPFLCTVALIKPGWTVENVKAALWTVLEDPTSPRLFDDLAYLQAILGPDVRELEPEEVEQKVRFQ